MPNRARAVFVDRDGVIIRNRTDYVKSWDEVDFIPRAIEALALLSRAGHSVYVITNQSAVGRGLITMPVIDAIHERIQSLVVDRGGRIDAFLTCPHRPEDACACRKPEPGLLHQARDRFGVDLRSAYVVGDHTTDMIAAAAAGCRSILVLSGRTSRENAGEEADYVAKDLLEAADLILSLTWEGVWQKIA